MYTVVCIADPVATLGKDVLSLRKGWRLLGRMHNRSLKVHDRLLKSMTGHLTSMCRVLWS